MNNLNNPLNRQKDRGKIAYLPVGAERENRKFHRANESAERKNRITHSPPERRRGMGMLMAALLSVALGKVAVESVEQSQPASIVRENLDPQAKIENPYEVKPGDSYWSIAEKIVGEKGDPQPVSQAIREANDDMELHPGKQLVIPGIETSE